MDIVVIGMVIVGMWRAFYLGSRKEKEKLFEIDRDLKPETLDIPEEVTEKEYQKALESWPEDGKE